MSTYFCREIRKNGTTRPCTSGNLTQVVFFKRRAEVDGAQRSQEQVTALIARKVPGTTIRNPACVAKIYPGFWEDFEATYG